MTVNYAVKKPLPVICAFEEVVYQCVENGLASGRLVATDSTHVKASASASSVLLVDAQDSPGTY